MIDATESISGSAYSDAYDKYMVRPDKNEKLVVPFAAWIDETGLTKNMRHPCQPFLINCLLSKREYQRNRLLALCRVYQHLLLKKKCQRFRLQHTITTISQCNEGDFSDV